VFQDFTLDENVEELYEMAPCGYLTTTIDGRIIRVNRTLAEWLGYSREQLTCGKRFVDLLTVGGRIFYDTHFNLLLRMQSTVNEIALDIVCQDGTVLPTLINARQKRDETGEPVFNRLTIFNSSERRMYERQLLAARDLFETTLSSIGDGVIATDAAGQVTFMNPVAELLCGWKVDTAAGKPIEEVMVLAREDNGELVENPVTHALRTGETVGLANHTILVSRDGRMVAIDDSASPIRDANGNVVGGVLVFRDVSEARRNQKALDNAYRQLEAVAAELRRSNENLSQFAYVASHDLRSPLNTVSSFVQLLEREYGDKLGDGKQLLGFVTDATRRMATLIEDLLQYARVSADTEPKRAAVDSNAAVKVAVENLRGIMDRAGATVEWEHLPTVSISETSLVQVFQNLIGNAIRYRSADPPLIRIQAKDDGEASLFSVEDNGIGIAPEHRTIIFEPFKRLHSAEVPGSGIGLAVCNRIIEQYNGRIWVEAAPNQGSIFYFTIPKQLLAG